MAQTSQNSGLKVFRQYGDINWYSKVLVGKEYVLTTKHNGFLSSRVDWATNQKITLINFLKNIYSTLQLESNVEFNLTTPNQESQKF